MATTPSSPAYTLWVELSTRVTTNRIHFRAGEEEAAARSVASLFHTAREAMVNAPEDEAFRSLTLRLLNKTLRPYTARWHGWMTEETGRTDGDGQPLLAFRDEQTRRRFRSELRVLQDELSGFKREFAKLAGIRDDGAIADEPRANLGEDLYSEIGDEVKMAEVDPSTSAAPIRDEIMRAEHREILRRRALLSGRTEERVTNAAGLALSGGGIRSATFCLGIVQVLVKRKLFPNFDYLSTVSGGGYLGSFLSCALGTMPTSDKEGAAERIPCSDVHERIRDVFERDVGREAASEGKEHVPSPIESGLLRHLRNNSKFLLNGGLLARLQIAGLLTSGILCNMLMLLPVPLGAASFAFLLNELGLWGHAFNDRADGWPALTTVAGVAWAASCGLLALFVLALPAVQKIAHGKPMTSLRARYRRVHGLACIGLACLCACAGACYALPALFHAYQAFRLEVKTSGAFSFVSEWSGLASTGAGAVVLGLLTAMIKSSWPRLRYFVAQLFILSGPVFFFLLFLYTGNHLGLGNPSEESWNPWYVAGVAAFFTLWGLLAVNINTLSPHTYYRNKLCECYLVRRRTGSSEEADTGAPHAGRVRSSRWWLTGEYAQGRTESLQRVPLTDLNTCPAAPYHLINTTLNLPASDNKELRGRRGDFFLVSKHFCGAPTIGYVPTRQLQEADPHLDLGTALAISAAAASANMGYHTLPNLRFLITLFNVRLGYWLRWPRKRSFPPGPGVWYLLREMFGSMHERCAFVNVSDGGHIENLGVYELLRRKCKFIVCVDGAMEPGMECADLTRLQRYAEIDLGIGFSYATADFSRQPNGFSRGCAILVKINYRPDLGEASPCIGWMIYLKLALTGDEPAYVMDYRRQSPTFPHETTADQIFEEAQFEAYRKLGECAAESLFRDELLEGESPRDLQAWFQVLANKLLSDNDPAFQSPQESISSAGKDPHAQPMADAAVSPPPSAPLA